MAVQQAVDSRLGHLLPHLLFIGGANGSDLDDTALASWERKPRSQRLLLLPGEEFPAAPATLGPQQRRRPLVAVQRLRLIDGADRTAQRGGNGWCRSAERSS